MNRPAQKISVAALICLGAVARAQVTYTAAASADAFLATGSTNNPAGADLTGLNFGAAGTLVIAPASSAKGEFQSLIQFNLAGATNFFNASCGTNNWGVSGLALELTSNYGAAGVQPNNGIFPVVSGGKFVIARLADDAWAEGTGTPNLPTTDGVTYDSLPGLLAGAHEILGTNDYSPPGNNVPLTYALPLDTNLVARVMGDGPVSLLFYAADGQIGYLFNSHSYGRGNEPLIHVIARPLPPKILSGYFTNGFFHLTARGGINLAYQVQAGSNLGNTDWQTIGTAAADGAGLIQFDASPGNQPQCFYRLVR